MSEIGLQDRLLSALERASAAESALRALADECENDYVPGWEDRMISVIAHANKLLAAVPLPSQPTQQDKLDAERCPTETQVLAITTAYEQGVGKGHQAFKSGSPIKNPYSNSWNCDKAWGFGYQEGIDQAKNADRAAIAATEATK